MKRRLLLMCAPIITMALMPTAASADSRHHHPAPATIRTPASLAGVSIPEGLAVDPTGMIYAPSIGLQPTATGFGLSATGTIAVLSRTGRLTARLSVPAGPAGVVSLFGAHYAPDAGLYVVDAGALPLGPAKAARDRAGRLLRINTNTGTATTITGGLAGPNAVTTDRHRTVYIADGLTGQILTMRADGSQRRIWLDDARLAPATGGFLGANGLAFDRGQQHLYITNPTTRQVLRARLHHDGTPGPLHVFADGAALDTAGRTTGTLERVDGIAIDHHNRVYLATGTAATSAIQVLAPNGTPAARYTGTAGDALTDPTSVTIHGQRLYISNTDFSSNPPGTNAKISTLPYPPADQARRRAHALPHPGGHRLGSTPSSPPRQRSGSTSSPSSYSSAKSAALQARASQSQPSSPG